MNKIIKFKFKMDGTLHNYTYKVKIYNIDNVLIHDVSTDKLGNLKLKVTYPGIYKIIVSSHNFKKCIIIYITEKSLQEYLFIINKCHYQKKHLITIKLTDQFYKDLPIMKGNVILWQENIS